MQNKYDFLGKGWIYPLKNERKAEADGYQSIEVSIVLIIGTIKGERVMRPDFGCDIHRLVFEPNVPQTHNSAMWAVKEALEKWEPRISKVEVFASADETETNKINVSVNYNIIATNTQRNLVYPFYITG